jgi:hypothetical protein
MSKSFSKNLKSFLKNAFIFRTKRLEVSEGKDKSFHQKKKLLKKESANKLVKRIKKLTL